MCIPCVKIEDAFIDYSIGTIAIFDKGLRHALHAFLSVSFYNVTDVKGVVTKEGEPFEICDGQGLSKKHNSPYLIPHHDHPGYSSHVEFVGIHRTEPGIKNTMVIQNEILFNFFLSNIEDLPITPEAKKYFIKEVKKYIQSINHFNPEKIKKENGIFMKNFITYFLENIIRDELAVGGTLNANKKGELLIKILMNQIKSLILRQEYGSPGTFTLLDDQRSTHFTTQISGQDNQSPSPIKGLYTW